MAETGTRKPLEVIKNEARPPVMPTDALQKAIKSLSAELLRAELLFLCQEFPVIIHTLEDRLLVRGMDVVRYHVDTDSEDDADSEIENEESASENDVGDKSGTNRESKKRKLIAKGDEEYTARMEVCENCKQEFDVTLNERGDCLWHPGVKDVNYESDFWADHDVDCHGPYEAFEDDPDFAEGFIWTCCERLGDDDGCKSTKHKANVNLVVRAPPPALAETKKRKAEEETTRTNVKKGRQ